MEKKYNISIQGEGTAEEILNHIFHLYGKLSNDMMISNEWGNIQSIAGTNEYCYADDGVLRTEVNEVNE